ncbi:Hpt domain-containing protein [Hydrogenophaga sp.]|uniref:Hpt domain-containing protein n=1 Tax=Hydrogenophaga sp. TaxID=1904254 RepID=UPI002FC75B99
MHNRERLTPWAFALWAALLVSLAAFTAASQTAAPAVALPIAVSVFVVWVALLLRRQAAQIDALQCALDELAATRDPAEAVERDKSAVHTPLQERQPANAVHPPDESTASPAGLIDAASYSEVVLMMPPATMDELLGTLFDPPEGGVHVLVAALAAGDPAQIAYHARKLKGSATLLGFRALVRTSAQIERLAEEDNPVLRRGLGNQLLVDMTRTQQALRRHSPGLTV